MRNIKHVLVFLFFGYALSAYAQCDNTSVPTLDVEPALKTVYPAWDLWWSRVAPVFAKKAGFPCGKKVIHVVLNPDPNFHLWTNNAPTEDDTVFVPHDWLQARVSTDNDTGPAIIVHELGHLAQGAVGNMAALAEGMAEASAESVYAELRRQGFNVLVQAGLSSMRMYNNLPKDAVAGDNNFYNQANYKAPGGWLLAMGGDLVTLNRTFNDLGRQMQAGVIPISTQTYLDAMDRILPKFEGKLPSTVYRSIVSNYLNGPDGTAFAAYPNNFVLDQSGKVVYADYPPLIRKDNLISWQVRTRINGQTTAQYNQGSVLMQATDVQGQMVMQATPYDNGVLVFPSTPPSGAYVMRTHWCAAQPCTTDSAKYSHDLPMFSISDPNWHTSHFVLICNGPSFSDIGKKTCRLSDPPPAGVMATTYGSLLYVTFLGDIPNNLEVTDGERTYTYGIGGHSQTQVAYWTSLAQPYIYVATDAAKVLLADNQSPNTTTAPGGWMTAWTWGASENDPAFAASLPLPANLSGVEALVTDSLGKQHQAGLNYTSQTQANIQIPYEAALGKAKVQIKTNGVLSNAAEIEITPTAPNVFPIGTTASGNILGAVTDALSGKLVADNNPASKNSWISIWLNSLGQTSPPQQSKVMALVAASTVYPVIVKIGAAVCAPAYSGIAPGFAGLYQININLAACQGLTVGNQPLVVNANGINSAPVEVVIR